MNPLTQAVILSASTLRMIPHIILYMANRSKIAPDLEKYSADGCGIGAFIKVCTRQKVFRNLFYYRLGEYVSVFIKWMLPPDPTLHIWCPSIGPGAHFEHNYATYLNAERIGSNFYCLQLVTLGNDGKMQYYNATSFLFGQYQKGYIGEYDFNISGNINNRVFLGATFGLHDVNYRSNKIYTEDDATGALSDNYEMLKIDGTGFDIKFGAIFRPVEDSPFRIGVYVNTPVFYDLTMRNAYDLTWYPAAENNNNNNTDYGNSSDYDFKVYTPWKFGVSLGHTIGDYLAMGLTYEYQKYGAIDNRINDGDSYYDYWTDSYYSDSNSDEAMNKDTELNLKSVHLLKVGLEYKPVQNFAIRLGYNYMSPQFNDNAYRDATLQSPGVGYATSADYTNWKATNRFTFGLGYSYGNFFADVAYQFSKTNGEFYPFMSYYVKPDYFLSKDNIRSTDDNVADATKVSFNRHQLLFTLGYRF